MGSIENYDPRSEFNESGNCGLKSWMEHELNSNYVANGEQIVVQKWIMIEGTDKLNIYIYISNFSILDFEPNTKDGPVNQT